MSRHHRVAQKIGAAVALAIALAGGTAGAAHPQFTYGQGMRPRDKLGDQGGVIGRVWNVTRVGWPRFCQSSVMPDEP
jgi:hypothetical protein